MTQGDDAAPAPSERRQSDRKKLIVDVSFDGGDATGLANTRDVGVGGLYLTTSVELDAGTPVSLRMIIAGREIRLTGAVVYADTGSGVGIRFHHVSEENRELLRRVLESS
jgi:hypothetical protein